MNEFKKIPGTVVEQFLLSMFKIDDITIDKLSDVGDYMSEYRCKYRVYSLVVSANVKIKYVPAASYPLKVIVTPEIIFYDENRWPGNMFKQRKFSVQPERFYEIFNLIKQRTSSEEYDRFFKVIDVYRNLSRDDVEMLVKLSTAE